MACVVARILGNKNHAQLCIGDKADATTLRLHCVCDWSTSTYREMGLDHHQKHHRFARPTYYIGTCSVYAAGSRCCRRGWNMKIFHTLTRSHPSNYLLTIINSSTRRVTKRQSLHHPHHPLKESFNSTQLFILCIGLPYSSPGLHIDSPILLDRHWMMMIGPQGL